MNLAHTSLGGGRQPQLLSETRQTRGEHESPRGKEKRTFSPLDIRATAPLWVSICIRPLNNAFFFFIAGRARNKEEVSLPRAGGGDWMLTY